MPSDDIPELDTALTLHPGFQMAATVTRKEHSHPAAYCLIHQASGEFYAGSTHDLYLRVNQHRTRLIAGDHKNRHLQAAFDNDSKFALAFVKTETKEEATKIEQKLLDDNLSSGRMLNISPDATVANKGVALSDKQKELLRQKAVEQFSTQEARDRHSALTKQMWEDPSYREKQQQRIYSEEERLRNSQAIKKKWEDPVYRAKMTDGVRAGKPVSVQGIIYPSTYEAARLLGMDKGTLRARLNNQDNFKDHFFITESEKKE